MKEIRLLREAWKYDCATPLGPRGGFGQVFLGLDKQGQEVAVKQLNLSSSHVGNRELKICEELSGKTYEYVIPFYDSGIDKDSGRYYIVMAKAGKSLQDLLNTEKLREEDAVRILTDIARGLREVGDIVHRDLKPGNVLFHKDKWKLADFGIARFLEESTSLNTLQECLTPEYAAPEQWNLERATKATDVYAFGCIGFALLVGYPPFIAGSINQLREKHLHENPAVPPVSPKLQQLISRCLMKSPSARPSVDSILKQLEGIRTTSSPQSPLAAAGAAVAKEEARREAETQHQRSEEEKRQILAEDGLKSLQFIIDQMFDKIEEEAPVARKCTSREILLGTGQLSIQIPFPYLQKGLFPQSKKNIVCGALISIMQNTAKDHYKGRSANLWFNEVSPNEFRWIEVSYFNLHQAGQIDPWGVNAGTGLREADLAMSHIAQTVEIANIPVPIDGEHMDDFIDRWLDRLAKASENKLQIPRYFPEQ